MSTVVISNLSWRDRIRQALFVAAATLSEMPFLEHLEELRKRLIKCLIALAAGTCVGFAYTAPIIQFLRVPAAKAGIRLSAIEATEMFSLYFKVALATGVCLAAPFILWQVWRFIEPALYKHERRYAVPFMISTILCFAAGAVFGYSVVTPWLLKLEVAMANRAGIEMGIRAGSYFTLLTATTVAMGLIFQMPAVIFILSRIGLVSARFLIRNFKYAVLLFSIAAAVLTPSTEFAPMLFFMAVMTGIYVISILVALIFGRARKTEAGM
jgi:sec-independent protein translocase protein TatC